MPPGNSWYNTCNSQHGNQLHMASRSRWKAVEREVARRYLGGDRIPVNGRQDRDVTDCYDLWCDVKSRLQVSAKYHTYLESALALQFDGFTHSGLVFLPITSFVNKKNLQCLPAKSIPAIAGQWLKHIAESAPADRLPCVALHIPGQDYAKIVIVFDAKRYQNHQFPQER